MMGKPALLTVGYLGPAIRTRWYKFPSSVRLGRTRQGCRKTYDTARLKDPIPLVEDAFNPTGFDVQQRSRRPDAVDTLGLQRKRAKIALNRKRPSRAKRKQASGNVKANRPMARLQ